MPLEVVPNLQNWSELLSEWPDYTDAANVEQAGQNAEQALTPDYEQLPQDNDVEGLFSC